MPRKKISEDALLAAADIDGATDYLPLVDASEALPENRNKRSLLNVIADWAIKYATSFVQSGIGAQATSVDAALKTFVHTSQYSTQGNYETARDALTGTTGVNNLDVSGSVTLGAEETITMKSLGRSFNALVSNFVNESTRSDFLVFGYNVSGLNAAREDAAEAAFGIQMEGNYESAPGGPNLCEFIFAYTGTDGTTRRPYEYSVNRSTHAVSSNISGLLTIHNSAKTTQWWNLADASGVLTALNGAFFAQGTNNIGALYQKNAAGTVDTELLRLNASNVVYIAPGGGGARIHTALTMGDSASPQLVFSPSSGATKTMQIYQNGNFLHFADNGVATRISLDIGTGHWLPTAANSSNLGSSSGTWRTGYFGTSLIAPFLRTDNAATGAAVNDTVQFYGSDDAAGHTIPSFYCEGTNVIATGQADSASSVRVKMRINGTVVTLLAI